MALTTVRPQGMGFNTGRRNLIINGAMQVAQRGTSFTNPANVAYTLDRWLLTKVTAGAVDISQSTEAPAGFYNSLKVDVTTADTSIAADDLYMVYQLVEDVNARHLEIGTSDAVNVSVSFWVRSSKTGTYCLNIKNYGSTRAFVKEYTINSADTWEKKELSIPMDTAGSGWYASGRAFALGFVVMAGTNYHISNETWTTVTSNFAPATSNQVNGLDSTANDFYITGVQLEVGTNASDFEHRSFGEELALCQRYYEKSYDYGTAIGTATYAGTISMGGGTTGSTTSFSPMLVGVFKVRKRAAPTVTVYDQAGTSGKVQRWQLGLTNSNGHTATVVDNSETNFKVYSGNGDNASGIQCHYEATAEL